MRRIKTRQLNCIKKLAVTFPVTGKIDLCVLALCLLLVPVANAQAEAESENQLILQKGSNNKMIQIKPGYLLCYKLENGEKGQGRVMEISDSTFSVTGVEVNPNQLKFITRGPYGSTGMQ